METIHFEGRDVPPHAVYASADSLAVGATYFSVRFVDQRRAIPELRPLVFIGKGLEEASPGNLYFQDAASYLAGIRFQSATGDDDAEFHAVAENTPFVFEFERALDRLLYCSMTRSRT